MVTVGRARRGAKMLGGDRATSASGPSSLLALQETPAPALDRDLLVRAVQDLALAEAAGEPGEKFRQAHLSALRAAAWLVSTRRPTRGRGRPRPVWELLEQAAPDLRPWAVYFASGADLRAAVESGRGPSVPLERAEGEVEAARAFLDVVEGRPTARAS